METLRLAGDRYLWIEGKPSLPEDVIAREVAVLEDRLWVGSNVGFLEIPLDTLQLARGATASP